MIHVANEILQTPTTTPCQRQRQSTVDPTPGSVARVRTKLMIISLTMDYICWVIQSRFAQGELFF